MTEPEVTEPEVTEPEITEPEITEPEETEPEVTEPEVTEPEETEPEETEPEITEPEVTEPEVTEPEAAAQEKAGALLEMEMPLYMATVPPPSVSISRVNYNTLKLNWTSVEDAVVYDIYRSTSYNGNYAKVGSTTELTFSDTGLTTGTMYYYSVYAVFADESVAISSVQFQSPIPETPENFRATNVTINSATLEWKKVAGATGYVIYSNGMQLATVDGGSTLKYIATGMTTGQVYSFQIAARRVVSDIPFDSALSSNVPVRPAPPRVTDVKGDSLGYNAIRLTWKKIEDASGYKIERATSANGTYVEVGNVTPATTTVFEETNLVAGTKYFYRVTSYVDMGGVYEFGPISEYCEVRPIPNTPEITSIDQNGIRALKINWTAVEGADFYRVYASDDPTLPEDEFAEIAKVNGGSSTSFVEKELEVGVPRYYYVVAYTLVADSEVASKASKHVLGVSAPDPTTNLKAEIEKYNIIRISWDEVPEAEGYELVYHDTTTNAYKSLGKMTETSFLHEELVPGMTYYYRVRTYCQVDDKYAYSDYTPYTMLTLVPPAPKNVSVEQYTHNTVRLHWNKVEGANGYHIYRIDKYSGEATYIKSINSANAEASLVGGLTPGAEVYLAVQAYCRTASGVIKGKMSEDVKIIPVPAAPEIVAAEPVDYNSVKLNWKVVDGVTGYEVYYRPTSEGGEYKRLGSVAGKIEATLDVPVPGKQYDFIIRAYVTVGEENVIGAESGRIIGASQINAPEAPVVQSHGVEKLRVTWKHVDGATGYDLYSGTSADGGYSPIKTFYRDDALLYDDECPMGEDRFYKVMAFCDGEEGLHYSELSPYGAGLTKPSVPADFKAQCDTYKSLMLTWTPVDGADGYTIYTDTKPTGTFTTLLTDITDSATDMYIHDNLSTGKVVYYKIAAYKDNGSVRVYSDLSEETHNMVKVAKPVITSFAPASATSGSMLVAWDKVAGATGYDVFISTEEKLGYKQVGTKVGLNYTISGLNTGTRYYVKVRGYRLINNVKKLGEFCDPVSAIMSLPAPQYIKAAAVDSDSIQVKWSKVTNATGYYVYRADAPEVGSAAYDEYKSVAKVPGATTLNVTLDSQEPGKRYEFRVAAYSVVDGVEYVSPMSEYRIARASLAAPAKFSAKLENSTAALSWSKVDGAEGYRIYRSENVDDDLSSYVPVGEAATANTLIFRDNLEGMTPGQIFYYRVVSYTTTSGTMVESDPAPAAAVTLLPNVPTNLKASYGSATSIDLTWDEDPLVEGYYIYRNDNKTDSPKRIAIVDGSWNNSYLDPTAVCGRRHFYRVRSYTIVDGKKIWSNYSDPVEYRALPSAPAYVKVESTGYNNVKLKWSKAAYANGYFIYGRKVGASDYTKMATISGGATVAAVISNLTCGQPYEFVVKSYRNVGSTKIEGYGMSTSIFATPKPNKPTGVAMKAQGGLVVKIFCNRGLGADGVEIMRCDADGSNEVFIKNVDFSGSNMTTYINSQPVGTYKYYLRSYTYDPDGNRVYGTYMNKTSVKVYY